MKNTVIDVILFVDQGITDEDLYLADIFSPDLIKEKIQKLSSETKIFFSVPEDYSGILKDRENSLPRTSIDDLNFWKDVFEKTGSAHIAVIMADSPFIDSAVIGEMFDLHLKYMAEFTFSENLPAGLTCEIISSELPAQLPETDRETLPLGQVVRSNINQFDVELYYKDPDIRDRRLSFRLSELRNRQVMEKIYSLKNEIPSYEKIKSIIDENPGVLFTSPSYVEIEITGKCSLDCLFCYRKALKEEHKAMTAETLEKLLSEMRGFSLPYTICFGGSGEPLDHPEIYSFMEKVCAEDAVEQLVIETNGIKADRNFKSFIEKDENSKIKVIVNNNGIDKDSYLRLHGEDFFDTVLDNIKSLNELNETEQRVFIQVMKINETDEFSDMKSYLDRYYDFWEGQNVPIILQKQNIYSGLIEDRRYSDLSPVKRGPCWHLLRDIYILSDGTITYCKQDVDGVKHYGNINSEPLENIWLRQKESFIKDYSGDYPSDPDCMNCDEWYTFNF